MMINTRTEFARDAAGGDAHRPFAAPLVSWPGGTWPPSARSVREQADAPGRLPSLVATLPRCTRSLDHRDSARIRVVTVVRPAHTEPWLRLTSTCGDCHKIIFRCRALDRRDDYGDRDTCSSSGTWTEAWSSSFAQAPSALSRRALGLGDVKLGALPGARSDVDQLCGRQ